jgi:3-hydroxybutyryl-CoA dehydrogenase
MSEDKKKQVLERITTTSSLEAAVQKADLVIEAVVEVLEAKLEILQRISAFAPSNAIITSNTSTITISRISSKLPKEARSRTLGLHFFNPPQIMKLVEIVKHAESDPDVVQRIVTLSTGLGKTPIVVNDSPGFVANRIGLSVFLEASDLLEKGVASVRDIDTAMRLGYGYPMGPFELGDLVGLDARLHNLESMYQESKDERFRPPEILKKLVAEGYLGDPKAKKASKGGYYEYYGLERVRD